MPDKPSADALYQYFIVLCVLTQSGLVLAAESAMLVQRYGDLTVLLNGRWIKWIYAIETAISVPLRVSWPVGPREAESIGLLRASGLATVGTLVPCASHDVYSDVSRDSCPHPHIALLSSGRLG